ncbi:MAG TPA: 3-deoxy-8-phosphooctulonate synthase, partial [Candidatus Kapabacteria bacterium]
MATTVTVPSPSKKRSVTFGAGNRFAVIAGPCVVENEQLLRKVAEKLVDLQAQYPVDFVFKSSYVKANRTSASSFSGIGMEAALSLLAKIRNDYDLPVLTDVHSADECRLVAMTCDV